MTPEAIAATYAQLKPKTWFNIAVGCAALYIGDYLGGVEAGIRRLEVALASHFVDAAVAAFFVMHLRKVFERVK